ncbi:flagellar protein FlaG [Ligilactobacillus sp. WC1T17]|jgi:flagellar protein FlaG|uniref:Flagellar protein FlaG n=1 Tax=Ligilactobacillus ruminis TaxID=1623 RepID=A0ABY1ADT5_9LACO|nr:flagellar protein FlaG [Ligilactobacillus ruminis]
MNLDGTKGILPIQPLDGINQVQKINTNVYDPTENTIRSNTSRDQEHVNVYESTAKKANQMDEDETETDEEVDEQLEIMAEEIKKQVEEINDKMMHKDIGIEFKLHKRTNRYYVQLVDKKTDKVVQEIPPKRVLDMLGKVWDELGIAVDKKG